MITAVPLPVIQCPMDRWRDTAEDLIETWYSDLSDSSPAGVPMDRDRAAEASETIREAVAWEDPDLLERGLREARAAWLEEPPGGYEGPPPEAEHQGGADALLSANRDRLQGFFDE